MFSKYVQFSVSLLIFLFFPSRLFFVQPPNHFALNPPGVCTFNDSITQGPRGENYRCFSIISLFPLGRLDHSLLSIPSSPPSLSPTLFLHPLPLIHLLPTCRVLFLALPICRSYCAAISDCDEIMGKWTCLYNPLTMSWEQETKKKNMSVTERISESIVLYNCLFLVITANISERSSAGDERFPFEWSSNSTRRKHVNITGETRHWNRNASFHHNAGTQIYCVNNIYK